VFDRFFEALYNKIYINILIGTAKTTVYIELCNKTGIINTATESFDTTTLNLKMRTFIEDAVSEALRQGYRTSDIYTQGDKLLSCSEMGDLIVSLI